MTEPITQRLWTAADPEVLALCIDGNPQGIADAWNAMGRAKLSPEERAEALAASEALAREQAIAQELAKLDVRSEAQRRIAEQAASGAISDERIEALLGEMLTSDGLDELEPLAPVIDDVLFEDSLARINGASGHGKSFVAIDMAGCIATGTPWHGRQVEAGPVVYVVAEGARGIKKRVRAWERHHGVKMTDLRFLPRPVQSLDPEWLVLIEACRRLQPRLIVLDTQARVTVGVEESSNTEMGQVVHRMENLRAATGACVLLIHHKGHAGEHGRGATAVKGAMQTELSVSKTRDLITLRCDKQKDDEEFDEIRFELTQVTVDTDPLGFPINSAVLAAPGADGPPTAADLLYGNDQVAALADVIREVFDTGSRDATKAEIKSVAVTERGVLTKSSFYRAWNELVGMGRIVKAGTGGKFRWSEPGADDDAAA